MDEILYQALEKYYHALEVKGYMSMNDSAKLLVLCFFRDFVFNDYRALLSKSDYRLIEKAIDCLYGASCLIPYPDYLKMGKLHLGEMTEMASRVKELENTNVIKALHNLSEDNQSDVLISLEGEANVNNQ